MRPEILLDEDHAGSARFRGEAELDSYLASENIKRETSPQEAAEAEKGMKEMSEVYREKGKRFYLPEG